MSERPVVKAVKRNRAQALEEGWNGYDGFAQRDVDRLLTEICALEAELARLREHEGLRENWMQSEASNRELREQLAREQATRYSLRASADGLAEWVEKMLDEMEQFVPDDSGSTGFNRAWTELDLALAAYRKEEK